MNRLALGALGVAACLLSLRSERVRTRLCALTLEHIERVFDALESVLHMA